MSSLVSSVIVMAARTFRQLALRWLTWSLIAASAGMLAVAAVSAAAPAPASLTAVPAQGAAGSILSLTVTGMQAGRVGTVWIGSTRLTRFRIDRRGDGSASVRVPGHRRLGPVRVRVVAGARTVVGAFTITRSSASGSSAFAALSTGESISLSPTRVSAGSSVQFDATGFRRTAVVQAWLGRGLIAMWRTDRRGAVRSSFVVPARTRPSAYALSIRSRGHRLSIRLLVTAASKRSGSGNGGGSGNGTGQTGGSGNGGGAGGPAAPTISQIPDQTDTTQSQVTTVTPATTGQVTSFTATGLPPGLQIDPTAGTISGTPSTTGTWDTTVTASGPGGPASTTFSWTIVTPPAVDAVGDMACSASDPNYNIGNGNPNIAAPGSDCLQQFVSNLVVNPLPDAFLDLGDNQYNTGSLSDYQQVFKPTFGRADPVTYPVLGNAEYNQGNSPPTGFFSYFDATGVVGRIQAHSGDASQFDQGYYSFNLGTWHIIALNSNCFTGGVVGGCAAGSTEELWLKHDLATAQQKCILAYWHHPLYSAIANSGYVKPFWTDLYQAHATLVLNGHGDHHFEVFAPQDDSGQAVPNGVREFIVSTGGMSHGTVPSNNPPNSQASNYDTFGILRLTLRTNAYDWQFVPAADGQSGNFTDSGTGTCS
jgi:Putative Ig domain/Calcineurin-like phosphoesterase